MKTTKKKARGITAVFILFLLLAGLCFAVPAESEKLTDHFTVWCDVPGMEGRLPVALVYAQEDGVLADGILHFAPLKDFLEWEYDAPTVVADGSSLYHVEYDSLFYDRFSEYASFYEPSEDSFSGMKKENGEPVLLEDLQPGDYLMAINIYAGKGQEYFAGAAFIHIIIPGGGRSVWPVQKDKFTPEPVSTPVAPPRPSPTPSPELP